LRPDAEDKHQHDEWHEGRVFDPVQIGELTRRRAGARAVKDPLVKREQENRRREQTETGERRRAGIEAEHAAENQKLADEAVESGQPERREHRQTAESGKDRRHGAQAAEFVQPAFTARARLEHADAEEQRGCGEPVIEHLEDRAAERRGRRLGVQACAARGVGDREEGKQAVAQVVDGRVGDHALEVGLLHRRVGAQHYAAERKPEQRA